MTSTNKELLSITDRSREAYSRNLISIDLYDYISIGCFTSYRWVNFISWALMVILGVFISIIGWVTLEEAKSREAWLWTVSEKYTKRRWSIKKPPKMDLGGS